MEVSGVRSSWETVERKSLRSWVSISLLAVAAGGEPGEEADEGEGAGGGGEVESAFGENVFVFGGVEVGLDVPAGEEGAGGGGIVGQGLVLMRLGGMAGRDEANAVVFSVGFALAELAECAEEGFFSE